MKNSYSIGDTVKLTKVSAKQLRYWEETKVLTGVQRVVCGERAYRYYNSVQIDLIKKIKEYLDMGFTLKASARLAKQPAEKGGR